MELYIAIAMIVLCLVVIVWRLYFLDREVAQLREYVLQGDVMTQVTNLPVPLVPKTKPINIVLDGPPGPCKPQFVSIETNDGKSIDLGDWHPRPDGKWSLRIDELPVIEPKKPWEM